MTCPPHLRRRHDDGPVDAGPGQELHRRQVFVAGARRRVHQEEVQPGLAPVHVAQQLLDESVLLGAAPDHGGVRAGQEEAGGHYAQVVVHVHGAPAGAGLVNLQKKDSILPVQDNT